jgi:hypothetical protein
MLRVPLKRLFQPISTRPRTASLPNSGLRMERHLRRRVIPQRARTTGARGRSRRARPRPPPPIPAALPLSARPQGRRWFANFSRAGTPALGGDGQDDWSGASSASTPPPRNSKRARTSPAGRRCTRPGRQSIHKCPRCGHFLLKPCAPSPWRCLSYPAHLGILRLSLLYGVKLRRLKRKTSAKGQGIGQPTQSLTLRSHSISWPPLPLSVGPSDQAPHAPRENPPAGRPGFTWPARAQSAPLTRCTLEKPCGLG